MPYSIPQYAMVAGEVSPEFLGRTDLVKYPLGLSLAKNFFIGYRGGIYSRAGTKFVGQRENPTQGVKLFRFRATGNDYVLVFGDYSMRVLRNGGYILETSKTITGITAADPGVVTATGHGYSTGDWVYISGVGGLTEVNGRLWKIGTTTTNTFQLLNLDGTNFDTSVLPAYTSGGNAARVYTLATPYSEAEVSSLLLEQRFNEFTLTHINHAPYKLTYVADTNWTLTTIAFGNTVPTPTNLSLTPSGAGSAGIGFSVTAVIDGSESLPSEYALTEVSVNYTDTAGSMLVEWDAVPGADWYYVYRTLVLPTGTEISYAQETGYLGRALSTQFTDNNIIPDFTKTPPQHLNPFANGTITTINVTASGTGYAKTDTVTVSGGSGSGFIGYPVVNAAGEILSVVIINGGENYTSPTVSFTTSTGSGATATATAGSTSGNNPRVYRRFQQRGVYAGTENAPMTLWGSRPGQVENFDYSVTLNDGDSYQFTLDQVTVKPIQHLVLLRSGLLVFTAAGVVQLRAQEGKAISPVNALAEPQAYKGVGDAAPVVIGHDVVFSQDVGGTLNAMQYTEYTNAFSLLNLSALSPHLVGAGKNPIRLEFAEDPDKLLWVLREDGILLSLTYEPKEEVFGWAQHSTKGYIRDCVSILEDAEWKLYMAVDRYINGAWVSYLEVMGKREQALLEDHWGVDAGVSLPHTYPNGTLTVFASTGTGVTFTSSVSVSASVGDIIYCGQGKAEVTAVVSGTVLTCKLLRDITDVIPEDSNNTPRVFSSGEWAIVTPADTLSGLWHLEGETVSVLADGDAFLDKTVTGGKITLDTPASKVVAGLPYTCRAKTLPPVSNREILEGHRRDIYGAAMQLYRTRGLSVGPEFTNLNELKDRTAVDWGDPLAERNDFPYEEIDADWLTDGVICIEQKYPLPATVLSFFVNIEKGDT